MIKKAEKQVAINPDLYEVVRFPVNTEKASKALEQKKYTFIVKRDVSKTIIKKAVEKVFGVEVAKVNTLRQEGKAKTFRGTKGVRQEVKKAVVTLKGDKAIDFEAGV